MVPILVVLWLQDSIFKTFQSRIEPRLYQIEIIISEEAKENVFQFNSEYQKVRLSGFALIGEYIRQAIRPTVVFPHAALILILLGKHIF